VVGGESPVIKMECMLQYALATRPWSFTAAAVPILVTAAVTTAPLLSINFFRAMSLGVTVQAGANLTNTYYDFVNGVDTKETVACGSGDKTLVDKKMSTTGVVLLSVFFYLCAIGCIIPSLNVEHTLGIFAVGMTLAFFYTAKPIGLKYKALGDVTIFICFGPLLMQCTSLLLTGTLNDRLYLYSVPIGLLTECILHANNSRDIRADRAAHATTLPTLVGFDMSRTFFFLLLIGVYASAAYIAATDRWGCISVFLTLPMAIDLSSKFRDDVKVMLELPEGCAKMHLPFGILMFLGIKFTDSGLLPWL